MLFNVDIGQNLTFKEVNLEKQKQAKEIFSSPKRWKNETKFYVNPVLS